VARATTRRVAWGLLDQVVSSGSNFLVTIIAARSLSASNFGAFALAMAVSIMTVFLTRGLASDPLSTAHASDGPEDMQWAVRSGAGTAVAASVAVAAATVVVGLLIGGTLGTVLMVLAVTLPGLSLQDYLRFVLIVRGQAKQTFLNDLFWTVLQIAFLLAAIGLGGGVVSLLLAWAVAGNLAAALGLWQARTWVGGPRSVGPWLRRHRDLWPFYVLDNMVYQATNLLLIVVISLATTLAQVGGFRAAMTLYAPLAIIGRGIVGVAVPELARRQGDPMAVRRASLTIAWMLTPLAVVWTVFLLLLPDSTGRALLGDSWSLAEPLLLLGGASTAVSLFTVGTVVGIRALGAGRDGLTARFVVSALVLAVSSVGAVADGAHGVLVALAWSAPFQIATWWWLLIKASRRDPRAGAPVDTAGKERIA
jgi:O-antigen/teichoic acid export membrane protein